jgi:hypothetical protein
MSELVIDGDIRLIVSTMGRDHSEAVVESVSLEALSDALCDLYTRMGCEACDREATAVLERGGTAYHLYSEDPDEAPEQVAVELWEKIVTLCEGAS